MCIRDRPGVDGGGEDGVPGGGLTSVVCPLLLFPGLRGGFTGSFGFGGGGGGTVGGGERSGSFTGSSGLRIVNDRVAPSVSTSTPVDEPGTFTNNRPSSNTSSGSAPPEVRTSSPPRRPPRSRMMTLPDPLHGT